MKLQENEPRLIYLVKIAIDYIRKYGDDQIIYYDEAECDGYCLSDDLENELESGDYILKADVVKMITELQAEVITESQDYHVRIAKLSVLSILKNQIKK